MAYQVGIQALGTDSRIRHMEELSWGTPMQLAKYSRTIILIHHSNLTMCMSLRLFEDIEA